MSIAEKLIIVIVGPTASGKSALAVKLALKLGGEIISADSRQVYRSLDIGTGKISREEMSGVPHHLLDVVNPKHQFSVALYKELGRKALRDIEGRAKVPIICGGTGFYISALLDDLSLPDVPPNAKLRKTLENKSADDLYETLKKLDPIRALNIEPKNPRRLIRAIEIAKAMNVKNLDDRANSIQSEKIDNKRNPIFIGLLPARADLRKRIRERLLGRMDQGLENEVKRLHARGLSWKRMEELGLEYRYLSRYLRGQISKEEMLKKLETEILRYAKRQMTWFKRDERIHWINI